MVFFNKKEYFPLLKLKNKEFFCQRLVACEIRPKKIFQSKNCLTDAQNTKGISKSTFKNARRNTIRCGRNIHWFLLRKPDRKSSMGCDKQAEDSKNTCLFFLRWKHAFFLTFFHQPWWGESGVGGTLRGFVVSRSEFTLPCLLLFPNPYMYALFSTPFSSKNVIFLKSTHSLPSKANEKIRRTLFTGPKIELRSEPSCEIKKDHPESPLCTWALLLPLNRQPVLSLSEWCIFLQQHSVTDGAGV